MQHYVKFFQRDKVPTSSSPTCLLMFIGLIQEFSISFPYILSKFIMLLHAQLGEKIKAQITESKFCDSYLCTSSLLIK